MGKTGDKENLMPKRNRRIKYTPEQLEVLERAFEKTHYPDTLEQEKLAMELNVGFERISVWFQNRRSRFKKQRQEEHLTWMRKQVYKDLQDMAQGAFGSPTLPGVTSACHVLSPIETTVGRNDALAESPCSHLYHAGLTTDREVATSSDRYPLHQASWFHHSDQTVQPSADTPRRPPLYNYQTARYHQIYGVGLQSTPPSAHYPLPTHSYPQPSPHAAFTMSQLPSLHSLTCSQATRSPSWTPGYHGNQDAETYLDASSYQGHLVADTQHLNSATPESADTSPSKATLDCLAQWD